MRREVISSSVAATGTGRCGVLSATSLRAYEPTTPSSASKVDVGRSGTTSVSDEHGHLRGWPCTDRTAAGTLPTPQRPRLGISAQSYRLSQAKLLVSAHAERTSWRFGYTDTQVHRLRVELELGLNVHSGPTSSPSEASHPRYRAWRCYSSQSHAAGPPA